jgi:sugar (pentulose or hexulose) kinase
MACIQQAAEEGTGNAVQSLVAVGGGARVPTWLQIKADVSGRPLLASADSEASLLGAAVLAGIGAGVYGEASAAEAFFAARAAITSPPSVVYLPDPVRHDAHQRLLDLYLALQEPLRQASAGLASVTCNHLPVERR